jgi:hypothetical protein
MPGSATIEDNLVDSLLSVVDDLRGELHPAMGVRHWRVYTVLRTWSGSEIGDGDPSDTLTEILPQPLVSWDLRNELTLGGLDEKGSITLSEVSLTYTEAELTGPNHALEDNQQWLYLLREAHGQAMEDRWFGIQDPPWPDRINTIGWIVRLKRQRVEDCP